MIWDTQPPIINQKSETGTLRTPSRDGHTGADVVIAGCDGAVPTTY